MTKTIVRMTFPHKNFHKPAQLISELGLLQCVAVVAPTSVHSCTIGFLNLKQGEQGDPNSNYLLIKLN